MKGKMSKKVILFVISTTTYSEQGDITAALSKQTKLKEQSISDEIMRIHQLHKNEKEAVVNQINLLKVLYNK